MQVEPAMAGKVLGADAVKGVMRYQHKNFLDNLPVPRASAVVSDLAHRLLVFPFSVCVRWMPESKFKSNIWSLFMVI